MRGIIIIAFLFISFSGIAQPYGNEWINENQQYYKFQIVEDGVFRIYSNELTNAGISTGTFNPQNIQLFHNGNEIPVYIKGEQLGVIEYIEFYGQKNNGSFDLPMYRSPNEQTNPYHSLINDTATYYLTWNDQFNNKRFQVVDDTDFNGTEELNYAYKEIIEQYNTTYLTSKTDCEYTTGEGFFDSRALSIGGTVSKTIPVTNISVQNLETYIDFAIAGFSSYDHHLELTLNETSVLDTIYKGLISLKHNFTINTNLLDENLNFTFTSINDQGTSTDYSRLSYIRAQHPINLDFQQSKQYKFKLPLFTSPRLLNISNVRNFETETFVLDLSGFIVYKTALEDAIVKVKIPSSSNMQDFILYSDNSAIYVSDLKPVSFTNFLSDQKEYIIISHPLLWSSAQEYSVYRNALLVNINELYDQFAYGINKHPMAIRNFADYITDKWDIEPKHLLLLGKSIKNIYTRNNETNYENCLVPSMGDPSSDNLLTARINGSIYEPSIPTGRISAHTNDEARGYLNKVKAFESNEPAEWMKNVIHFGGGYSESEQIQFANNLKTYENIIEDTLFGANVSTFLKTSSSPIQITQTDSVKKVINEGCSLMTFFGHAYSGGFDQNIDDPKSFDNYGKFPLLLANSCYSGNIHLASSSSTSEKWVLIDNKGTIAFFAVVYEAYSTNLHDYSTRFFTHFAKTNYGNSLGRIIQETTKEYQSANPNYQNVKNTCLEFTLHGDPGIVLNSFEKPDYTLLNSSIFYSESNISTVIDSFEVNIVTTNIGKAVRDSFSIHITRTYPNGDFDEYLTDIAGCVFKDTLKIKMPVDLINGPGNNIINVYVDNTNKIDELNELNNSKESFLFIRSSNIIPLMPYDLSVYPNSDLTLTSSTGDPNVENISATIEIDTSYYFTSPFLQQTTIEQNGGIIEWKPDISLQNNQVYYWRIKNNSEDNKVNEWAYNSFYHTNGEHGWSQASFDQFRQSKFTFIEQDIDNSSYEFIKTPKLLRCTNIGSPTSTAQFLDIKYDIDGNVDVSSCGTDSALIAVVFDSTFLIPWLSDRGNYGHVDYPKCYSRNRPDRYYVFESNIAGMNSFTTFINEIVPDGNYVLVYSINRTTYSAWDETVFETFEDLGSQQIRGIPNDHPFIFFTQKGNPDILEEIIGSSKYDIIKLETTIKTTFYYGTIESPKIGPSFNWNSFEINIDETSLQTSDSINISITGITPSGQEVILLSDIQGDTTINNLDDFIDSGLYPNIKLSFLSLDNTNYTPAIIESWKVLFDCAGEIALAPNKGYYFYSDTVQQGDNIKFSTSIENVSPFDMDSLVLKYWIQDNYNNVKIEKEHKIDSVKAGEIINDTVSFSSLSLSGGNHIWLEANPINKSTNQYYQEEAYHFNNLIYNNFHVKEDDSNPILDITFDGYHIIDGELISPQPEIMIQLLDENNFLAINDTSFINIYIKSMNDGIEKRISFSSINNNLEFFPAELPDNKCKIIYNPIFIEDGKYTLRVQAVDASNNESGDFDYTISFEIITKSTITKLVNYPNPFSTATKFVFTLTGSEIPDDFRIQIFTISGKLVKEIDLTKEDNIRIGKNITSYTWDGRDMFGDKLANGVYFYKVYCSINGQSIENNYTEADNYFHKNFGKMVILR